MVAKPESICSGASPEQVIADLEPLVAYQDEGLSLEELNRLMDERLLPHLMRYDRPSFQSMFNSFVEPGADLGAKIALRFNQGVTNWQVSPGGAVLEELCCQALCRLFGLSPGADGTFLYSGTYGNHQALYTALHRRAEERGFDLAQVGVSGFGDPSRLAVVASADAHFSLKHTVRVMGLGERSLVRVDVDDKRRMDPRRLAETLKDLAGSREVFCVVATAGTTSTGAVDPIEPVADLCKQVGTWLHVDGAYGLAYKLVPEWSHLFAGVERADSVSWDPHKQFGVPIPSSILFLRKPQDFDRMALFSSYFNREDAREPNPGFKSMPSTRPFSALPLVASIRHQGLRKVIQRLGSPLESVARIVPYIESQSDLELSHSPDTGILCFRIVPEGFPAARLDRLQKFIYQKILRDGRRSISVTELNGRMFLRLVAISPSVDVEAMRATIEDVRRVAKDIDLQHAFR